MHRMLGTLAVAVTLIVAAPGAPQAADRGLPGKKLLLKSGRGEKLVWIVKGQITTVPAPGSSVDPRQGNASLLVINPGSKESAVFDLPGGNWTGPGPGVSDPRRVIYKYRNGAAPGGASPAKSVLFKPTKGLKVVSRGIGITLDEVTQGSLAVVFRTGVLNYCSVFGGTIKKDQPGKFLAKGASAPSACPAEVPCGNGRLDAGEECEASVPCGAAETCVNCQCVGTGDVAVQLLWSDENDLDLHVTDPNGVEVYWRNTSSPEGGRLDQDANGNCVGLTTTPVENIFWPSGTAPSGEYRVEVTLFDRCGEAPTESPFTVRTIIHGVATDFPGVVSTATGCDACLACGTCTFVTTFTR